jgi:hypothetical protein
MPCTSARVLCTVSTWRRRPIATTPNGDGGPPATQRPSDHDMNRGHQPCPPPPSSSRWMAQRRAQVHDVNFDSRARWATNGRDGTLPPLSRRMRGGAFELPTSLSAGGCTPLSRRSARCQATCDHRNNDNAPGRWRDANRGHPLCPPPPIYLGPKPQCRAQARDAQIGVHTLWRNTIVPAMRYRWQPRPGHKPVCCQTTKWSSSNLQTRTTPMLIACLNASNWHPGFGISQVRRLSTPPRTRHHAEARDADTMHTRPTPTTTVTAHDPTTTNHTNAPTRLHTIAACRRRAFFCSWRRQLYYISCSTIIYIIYLLGTICVQDMRDRGAARHYRALDRSIVVTLSHTKGNWLNDSLGDIQKFNRLGPRLRPLNSHTLSWKYYIDNKSNQSNIVIGIFSN